MKIDRSKLKKSSSEVPADCKALIERLTACGRDREAFLRELQRIETWTYGKCELFHWIDVLDLCDEVLEMAAAPNQAEVRQPGDPAAPWLLSCDATSMLQLQQQQQQQSGPPPTASAAAAAAAASRLKELLLWTLHFTTLLIEHSFSRHLYSSMEHLTMLLASSDLDVVLAVLNLLYMFSKRSNFITRLAPEKRSGLLGRLTHLAASWGGKENGFGLAKCCSDDPVHTFPESATTLHFEYYAEVAAAAASASSHKGASAGGKNHLASTVTVIHVENVDKRKESPARIMGQILRDYQVPKDKQMLLFTYLRLAASFSDYSKRLKCVQARLQALSVLIYSNQLTDNVQNLLYSGLLEELVEVLEMSGDHLMEIKAAALKALTSIIHLDRNPNFPKLNTIIDVTGASSYHGFLPVLVRNCIASLTGGGPGGADGKASASKSAAVSAATTTTAFPQPLATALFSFLYHLASYEAGGEALVSCGMLESLLKVIQWPSTELDHITFVTRAVRVIDLITNLDMGSFQTHSGLACFIDRLELEVDHCRQQQPFEIRVSSDRKDSLASALEQQAAEELAAKVIAEGGTPEEAAAAAAEAASQQQGAMEVDDPQPGTSKDTDQSQAYLTAPRPGVTCLPQRAALLKSMLNFLKKAIQDSAFSDSIRHVMDLSLPASLRHIISNAEYYGPSLFLLATDVVTAYVFQEPSLLSSLQDKGLTDVVLHALLVKDVPATREVLGSLPNVFSALCLNNRGLNAFVQCKPFERLFKVLLSPDYLPAMRRRRSSDPMGDTASNLGNAMDELMRHQPSLKQAATGAIIKLLEEVCALGRDPKYICWKSNAKPEQQASAAPAPGPPATGAGNEAGSSDEEDEEEEEGNSNQASGQEQPVNAADGAAPAAPIPASQAEKEPVPLVDYIHNVMKFVDAILSNNSTDDHCREFVQQKGLVPLMGILGLPNLPIDFPTHQACQSVAAVSKSILTLAHEPQVLKQGLLHLNDVLKALEPLHRPLDAPGGSVLLRELVTAPVISEATANPQATPLLHFMSSAHAYIQMFVHVCRTGQSDIRSLSINHWGSELGLTVLKGLSRLYTSLVWESTVLLALCSEDTLPPGCEFGRADMDKLLPPNLAAAVAAATATASASSASSSSSAAAPAASASAVASSVQNAIELRSTGGTENEETFSPASGTSADSNSSVTAAMENLSTDPEVGGSGGGGGMEVDNAGGAPAPTAAPAAAPTSNGTGAVPANGAQTSEAAVTKGEKSKEKPNPALHYQIKQIKPLLSGSSRLGRALAELFALLVKLCVGSPLRQRRGQQIPTAPSPPSAPARAVASALTKLLASGLSWEPPPTSPVPRFRLTFFICSVGFTAPMLFDEKKYPYHLMLMKFISSGGQKAFFDTFYWALSCGNTVAPEDGLEHPDLPDGTGEFLDSWLLLLEKMVNPKTVLESPHTLPAKPTGNFKPFDPMKYLARTHKLAFLAVMKLWGKKPLKMYGPRMTESVLSILCHILKGEKMVAEKTEKKAAEGLPKITPGPSAFAAANVAAVPAAPAAAPLAALAPPAVPPAAPVAGPSGSNSSNAAPPAVNLANALQGLPDAAEPNINSDDLRTLMDMGFPRERCVEAMQNTGSLDQATEYLLHNPIPPLNAASAMQNMLENVAASGGAAASLAGHLRVAAAEIANAGAGGEQDELMRAIAMSLGENVMVSTGGGGAEGGSGGQEGSDAKKEEQEEEERFEKEDFQALDKSVIDEFTENALVGCLSLLDTLPDTVYRVCDLLLAVFARNGDDFKERVLRSLIQEVIASLSTLNVRASSAPAAASDPVAMVEELCSGADALRASARIHLFTLLFEDCSILCARIVDESRAVADMTRLLSSVQGVLKAARQVVGPAGNVETPKWMTPMLLFIDLHEKVILGMNRRARLAKICSHNWKWFDISSGRWCSYAQANNKTIDDAYWAGDTSVKIQNGRRKYTIQFGTMMQANEETGNRRPVMISVRETNTAASESSSTEPSGATAAASLPPPSTVPEAVASVLGGPQASSTPMEESPPDTEQKDQSTKPVAIAEAVEQSATEQQQKASDSSPKEEEAKTTIPMLDGLSSSERMALLKACVALVDVPVDPDALNAVLRLCLRLTQDFDQAVLFTQLGGVKMLLNLTQSSNFTGFTSLATLLIRHVLEDPATLRHTMEKVVRSATMSSNSPNTKELHYMLRTLAPAACRSPEVFVAVSKEILRVDFGLLSKRTGETDGQEDQRLLLKSLPPKNPCGNAAAVNGTQPPQQQMTSGVVPPLLDVSHTVICDLLNFLVQPEVDDKAVSETASTQQQTATPNASEDGTSTASSSGGTANASNRTQVIVRNSSSGELSVPSTDNVIPGASSDVSAGRNSTAGQSSSSKQSSAPKKDDKSGGSKSDDLGRIKKPLLTKSVVCRLLAELVKSYSSCAKLITDHVYEAGSSELIKEDTTALAFLLDELLISKVDKDIGHLVKTLVAALASCNHHSEAQTTLVAEVKAALARALAWPESNLKHTKVQALTTLVSTMIESCPPSSPTPPNSLTAYKQQQQLNMNNMVKILLKKGIISDLARVPHSLDLSSPNVAATVNAALKPLEILTRIVNTPTAMASRAAAKGTRANGSDGRGGRANGGAANGRGSENSSAAAAAGAAIAAGAGAGVGIADGSGGGGAGTNTTNSEATRAQGDETVEPDAEATEHDVSTAAESIDPNSESQLQTVEEGNDEEFEEMMDQLLDRDGQQDPPMLEVIEHSMNEQNYDVDDTQHDSQMLTQDESQFEAQAMSQDEEDQESESSSRSEAATEENEDEDDGMDEEDDEDDDNGDEEDEDEEDDGEDDEEDEDEDEGVSPFDDEDNEFQDVDDAIYNFPDHDADDIDLMIHYPDSDAHLQSALDMDRSRAIQLPLWSDVGGAAAGLDGIGGAGGVGGAGGGHVAPTHPLLSRQPGVETASARTGTRSLARHRGGGIRIHLNSRNDGTQAAAAAAAANTPAILQNLFGSRSELVTQGLRRGGAPLLVDFGFAILDQLGIDSGDVGDMDGGNSVLGGGGTGGVRAALGSIPSALIRWTEESRVIDGDSVHDSVTALKPPILEVVEKARAEELAERRAKKKKQAEEEAARKEEEKKKKQEEEQAAAAAVKANAPKIEVSDGERVGSDQGQQHTSASAASTPSSEQVDPPAAAPVQPQDLGSSAITSAVVTRAAESLTVGGASTQQQQRTESSSSEAAARPADQLPAALGPLSPSPEEVTMEVQQSQQQQQQPPPPPPAQSAEEEDVNMETAESAPEGQHQQAASSQPPAAAGGGESDQNSMDIVRELLEFDSSVDPSTRRVNEEQQTAAGSSSSSNGEAQRQQQQSNQQPEAGPSGTTRPEGGGPDYSAILGIDVSELPEDVDPSFLAALPEEMRQEIIDDQRRRRRAAQQASAPAAAASSSASATDGGAGGVQEVSAEFLAALPPNIQEEVLAQQRMEAQRQAAANANPEAPVDPGEFLQNLPASLRQSVLADLEESQMSALPADLAAEAASLRREYDLRNHRAMMHDRFFGQVGGGGGAGGTGATLSSILRNAHRLTGSYHVIGSLGNASRDGWRSFRAGAPGGAYPASLLASTNLKIKGKQLLDNEGLSCLLILLFIDDPKINTTRLHRILKYLCYHGPTRDWVVNSLLSILEKSNEGRAMEGSSDKQQQQHHQNSGFDTPPAKIRKSTSKSSALTEGRENGKNGGNPQQSTAWLNISMDAALGFRANVFQVQRAGVGKKSNSSGERGSNSVTIHPGASTVVCRHTLEVLISLAKSFPVYFLPWKDQDFHPQNAQTKEKEEAAKNKSSKAEGGKKGENAGASDFWDTLLRLDQQSSSSRKGKSVVRSHSSVSSFKGGIDDDEGKKSVSFDASIFGQLLSMLSSPVIRRNSVLTDKLLRLLSLISVQHPDFNKRPDLPDGSSSGSASSSKAEDPPLVISAQHLKLAVEVLTSKACSEEGLEDVNALLLNLSYGPEPTRDTILKLLLQGAQELGNVVRQNVIDLQQELRRLKDGGAADEEDSGASSPGDAQKKAANKGLLMDRFTKDQVVLTAPSKVKGGSELQLPSMNALTSKTSSQAFFLRVLKVIIQLREAALLAMKKNTIVAANAKAAASAAAAAAATNAQPAATPAADDGATVAPAAATPSDTSAASAEPAQGMEVDSSEAATDASEKKTEEQPKTEEDTPSTSTPPQPESLESLSDQLQLENLWDALSGCLKDLADTPDHHAVLVLQATVEAFFLVHAAATQPDDKKKVQQKETRAEQLAHIQEQLEAPFHPPGTSSGPPSLSATPSGQQQQQSQSQQQQQQQPAMSKDTGKFLSFAETHRTVLNQILRQSTTHLADGPFSVLVDHTRVLDFDIKRRYFRTELERLDEGMRREDLAVHVRRDNVFEDSFRELHRRSPDEWKNRFYIVFEGEEGQDAGGLLREWYVIISREIFNPMYALFKTSPGDRVTYMIYEQSQTNPNHLDYFKFVGRVIAKAIYDNKLLECYFSRSFYKHILAKAVKFQDMESEDYSFYKGLEFLTTNKVEDLGYDLTFSLEVREFGITEVRDLIPNGRNIKVTEDNKDEYVHRVCQMKMTGAIRKQLSAFLEGFYNIIPRRLISIFNEQELELLLSGLPTIDVDDLKANTEYHKYQANSLQIVWFWRALRSFDQTDKAKFMQFVTGSSKVPLQGFSALEGMNGPQKFQIHRDDRSTDRLPSAHTCFNQLDLPAYETYDKLRTYLLKAVQECSEGFGFA